MKRNVFEAAMQGVAKYPQNTILAIEHEMCRFTNPGGTNTCSSRIVIDIPEQIKRPAEK
jgi:DNA topoisomerase VI subunit B